MTVKRGKTTVSKGSTTIVEENGSDLSKLRTNDGKAKKLDKSMYSTGRQEKAEKVLDKYFPQKEINTEKDK